jgi:hypothetical protein
LARIAVGFFSMLWYTVKPFNPTPEAPEDPPAAEEVAHEQLEQCQKLFDDVESSRDFLEAKARATFSIIAFLAPLTATIFVVLLSRSTAGPKTLLIAEIFAAISVALMILAFVSIARAVSVQKREALGLQAIIDFDKGAFRPYNKGYHAQGLLYCASVNQAMNAHIAQFVKSAHVFTTIAVLALMVAATPTGLLLANEHQTTKTELTGPVTVTSSELTEIRREVSSIAASLSKIEGGRADKTELEVLTATLDRIVTELDAIRNELAHKLEVPATLPKQPSR